jgi:hypothetical protein
MSRGGVFGASIHLRYPLAVTRASCHQPADLKLETKMTSERVTAVTWDDDILTRGSTLVAVGEAGIVFLGARRRGYPDPLG